MNPFRLIGLAAGGMVAGYKSALGGATARFLRGEDGSGDAGGAELVNPLTQSPWVYGCISQLAQTVAGLEFYLEQGKEGAEKPVLSGPLFDLLQQPHPLTDRFAFWELVVHWLGLRGEAFVVGIDAAGGVVDFTTRGGVRALRSLVILSPDHLRHMVDGHELVGWAYTGSPRSTPLPTQFLMPSEVIHWRMPNPYDTWRGLSPLRVATLPAQTDYAAAQFSRGLMLNNADMGLIVSGDAWPTEEQRETILAALRDRKRKVGIADRPLLLGGGLSVERPNIASADLQLLANRKFDRQTICAIYGVPQELLGFTEDANRSVGESARQNFVENRIAPLCERLAAPLQPMFRAFAADLRGEFAVEDHPAMQAARRARFVTAKDIFAGMGVPVAVLDDVFDLGLPELPHGRTVFLPFSLQASGEMADAPATAPASTQEDAFAAARSALLALQRSAAPAPVVVPAPVAKASNGAYEASIAGSVKDKIAKLGRFFFEQRSRVLAALEEKYKAKALTKAAGDIFDQGAEDALLKPRINKLLVADLEFGGAQLFTELDLGAFVLPPQAAIDYLALREPRIVGINGETGRRISSTIADGLGAGDSFEQLRKRVQDVFTDATDRRAEVIALTETNSAVNSGRFGAMETAGVEAKGWLTSHLDGTRASHLACEEQGAIGVTDLFANGLMHPGDPSGPPEEVINCRCHLTAEAGPEGRAVPRCERLLTWEEHKRSRMPQDVSGGVDTRHGASKRKDGQDPQIAKPV